MKFTGVITVYNTVEADFKMLLLPKLLSGVHIEVRKGAEKAAEGDKNTDELLIIIPFNPHKNGFLKLFEYEACEDKSGIWTLAAGDVIAIGDTGAAENFAELTARAETFRIQTVKTFDFGSLQHWEVTAK